MPMTACSTHGCPAFAHCDADGVEEHVDCPECARETHEAWARFYKSLDRPAATVDPWASFPFYPVGADWHLQGMVKCD